MMDKISIAQSVAYLKQALPLMYKHQIPTTPMNYHLWYNYVSGCMPELNQAIDLAIIRQGACSLATCEQVYQHYLASSDEQHMEIIKNNLAAMTMELSHSMQDTIADTNLFQTSIDKNFAKLAQIESEGLGLEETMAILRDIVQQSRQIKLSTLHFRSQLSNAEQEIKALRDTLSEIRKVANEDPLTKLLNRRAFDQEITALINNQQVFSLILSDIDHFKKFNDEYGHQLGDHVLKAVAKRLSNGCKEGLTAYRLGGEEFALLVPFRPLSAARQMAESLRRSMEKIVIQDRKSGRRINNITLSFGVGEYNRKEERVEEFFERTDMLLYKAKELGRNRVMPLPL